jgi:hypothetical protein
MLFHYGIHEDLHFLENSFFFIGLWGISLIQNKVSMMLFAFGTKPRFQILNPLSSFKSGYCAMSHFTLCQNSCAVNAPILFAAPGAPGVNLLTPWFPLPLDDIGGIPYRGPQYSA